MSDQTKLSPVVVAAIGTVYEYLRFTPNHDPSAREITTALLLVTGSCVVGRSCAKHGGVVHGQEAEELRAGIEQILSDSWDVREVRKSLLFLLDRIDARDSLTFREMTDKEDDA